VQHGKHTMQYVVHGSTVAAHIGGACRRLECVCQAAAGHSVCSTWPVGMMRLVLYHDHAAAHVLP
jgi:hypothetical protein